MEGCCWCESQRCPATCCLVNSEEDKYWSDAIVNGHNSDHSEIIGQQTELDCHWKMIVMTATSGAAIDQVCLTERHSKVERSRCTPDWSTILLQLIVCWQFCSHCGAGAITIQQAAEAQGCAAAFGVAGKCYSTTMTPVAYEELRKACQGDMTADKEAYESGIGCLLHIVW
jgi:hypothetical protein